MIRVVISTDAEADALTAFNFYEERREGLGERFRDHLGVALSRTQVRFARAMGIGVHTLRNWEQDRRSPEGPALALLRIAARHPRILRENLRTAA